MIRPACPADAPIIACHRYPAGADAAERPVYAAWVTEALERGVYLGFLAVADGGGVVAGAGLTLLEWGPTRGDPQPYRARVVNVWTHPDYRRRGLARELVTRCLQTAQERSITRVSLGTSEMGRALYKGLGFQASGTEMALRL
ncbi:ribosomal protein S18 acetylase RimI-like enzyme [Deinococcus metallilatus]|uniref:Ribosomal protein S18 acetylase RimI-like enzyme n=1 Tax=Deinococcus metallilatus TaxID=1211322 RepID=A0ABR6MX92_9DEIO|nr:ribosomal protein S18 acetylase RimI-like enzyme [Deinococcus metallilatus]